MSDTDYFVRFAWRASVVLLFVIAGVIAAMPRDVAPDVAEGVVGVALVLATLPRIGVAVMRWYDGRTRR
jgi:uncharacterized membrane protein YhaH (DUF805 family)